VDSLAGDRFLRLPFCALTELEIVEGMARGADWWISAAQGLQWQTPTFSGAVEVCAFFAEPAAQ